jgi:anti-sigma-K factor RskA
MTTAHEWQDLAAPYALGALAPEERRTFEAHLTGCDACRAEVRSFAEVAGLLAYGAPSAEPPVGLRVRVLAEARRVRPIAQAPRRRATAAWLAAAAGMLLAVAAGIEAWRLAGHVRALENRIAVLDSSDAVKDSTLAMLTGPQVHVVSLAATGRAPSARVFWNHTRGRFIVLAFDLPPAPAGRAYQLWAIAKGQAPMSMGTFNTDAAGRATVVLPVGRDLAALGFVDNCGLTEEPAGGSPQPTETPRLLGAWVHTD